MFDLYLYGNWMLTALITSSLNQFLSFNDAFSCFPNLLFTIETDVSFGVPLIIFLFYFIFCLCIMGISIFYLFMYTSIWEDDCKLQSRNNPREYVNMQNCNTIMNLLPDPKFWCLLLFFTYQELVTSFRWYIVLVLFIFYCYA